MSKANTDISSKGLEKGVKDKEASSDLKKVFENLGINAKNLRDNPLLSEFDKKTAATQKLIKLLNAIHAQASMEETIYSIQLQKEGNEKIAREHFYETQHFENLCLQHAKQQKKAKLSHKFSKMHNQLEALPNDAFLISGYDYVESDDSIGSQSKSISGTAAYKAKSEMAFANIKSFIGLPKSPEYPPVQIQYFDTHISQEDLINSQCKMFPVAKFSLLCLRIFKIMPRLQAIGLAVIYQRNPELVKQLFKDKQQHSLAFVRDIVTQKTVDPQFYDLYEHGQLLLLKLNHFLIEGPENLENALFLLSKQLWLNDGLEAILKAFGQYLRVNPLKKTTETELDALFSSVPHMNKWTLEKPSLAEILSEMSSLKVQNTAKSTELDALSFKISRTEGQRKVDFNLEISGILPWFNPVLYLGNLNAMHKNISTVLSERALVSIDAASKHRSQCIRRQSAVDAIIKKEISDLRKNITAYYFSPMAMAGIDAVLKSTTFPTQESHSAAKPAIPQPQPTPQSQQEDDLARVLRETKEVEEKRVANLKIKIIALQKNETIQKSKVESLITALIEKPEKFPRDKDALHTAIADIAVTLGILQKLTVLATATAPSPSQSVLVYSPPKATAAPAQQIPNIPIANHAQQKNNDPIKEAFKKDTQLLAETDDALTLALKESEEIERKKQAELKTRLDAPAKKFLSPSAPLSVMATVGTSAVALTAADNSAQQLIGKHTQLDTEYQMNSLNFPKIEGLDTDKFVKILSVLAKNKMPGVKMLNLNGVILDRMRMVALIDCILKNPSIIVLDIRNASLSNKTGLLLLSGLQAKKDKISLRIIKVGGNLFLEDNIAKDLIAVCNTSNKNKIRAVESSDAKNHHDNKYLMDATAAAPAQKPATSTPQYATKPRQLTNNQNRHPGQVLSEADLRRIAAVAQRVKNMKETEDLAMAHAIALSLGIVESEASAAASTPSVATPSATTSSLGISKPSPKKP